MPGTLLREIRSRLNYLVLIPCSLSPDEVPLGSLARGSASLPITWWPYLLLDLEEPRDLPRAADHLPLHSSALGMAMSRAQERRKPQGTEVNKGNY